MRERARWHSRRGLLEVDLLLEKFLAHGLERLDEDALRIYDELMMLPDNELLDIVMGRKPAPNQATGALLKKIADARDHIG
jgi:succinate dehydrogenase flavin-adding protein (antitoxin of CptAB toxin-antitoxin module)